MQSVISATGKCQRMGIVCEAKTTKGLRKPRQLKPSSRHPEYEQQGTESGPSVASQQSPTPSSPLAALQLDRTQPPQPPLPLRTPLDLFTSAAASSLSSSSNQPAAGAAASDPSSLPGASEPPEPHHEPEADSVHEPPYGFTWEQTAAALVEFKLKFMPHFPFVVFENADVTPFELLHDRPFLLRAIILVAMPLPGRRQEAVRKRVLQYLADRLLVKEQRTLDLLQGLLVCLAWADFDVYKDQQMTHLIYLATGYAYSLGITKIPLGLLEQMGKEDPQGHTRQARVAELMSKVHSLEEQRAYLGCFYLMALNSLQWGRKNPMRGQWVEMCCDTLAWSIGAPTDFVADKTTRLLRILERICELFGSPYDRERGRSFAYLIEGQTRPIRLELDKVAESVGPNHPHFAELYRQYNYILVRLYEPATYVADDNADEPMSLARHQCLFHCLEAINAFFKQLLTEPAETALYRTFAVAEQVQFVTAAATRILLLDCAGWDLEAARSVMDFGATMDGMLARTARIAEAGRERVRRFAEETGQVLAPGELEAEGALAPRLAEAMQRMRFVKGWYEGRVAGQGDGDETMMAHVPAGQAVAAAGLDDGGYRGTPLWMMGMFASQAWDFDNLNL